MYDYQKERPKLFTEDGTLLVAAVAFIVAFHGTTPVSVGQIISDGASLLGSVDSWICLAAIDFLVEKKAIQWAAREGAAQHWLVTGAR